MLTFFLPGNSLSTPLLGLHPSRLWERGLTDEEKGLLFRFVCLTEPSESASPRCAPELEEWQLLT